MSILKPKEINYFLRKTDKNELPIVVNRRTINDSTLDISLIGKRLKEYGEPFNTNMLALLENFSCKASNPEGPITLQEPDISETFTGDKLAEPLEGQLWYNSSNNRLYFYKIIDGFEPVGKWVPLAGGEDVGGNSGQLNSGETIPRPISHGYEFPYEECNWIVSPFSYPEQVEYMECYTEKQYNNGVIVDVKAYCEVRFVGHSNTTFTPMNYQIIGIRKDI